jgi:neopullulanase
MNYVFTGPVISYCAAKTYRNDYIHHHLPFAPFDAAQLATQIDKMYGYYDWEINFAQMNMLDSHDMARIAWIVQDESAQRMCVLFQMTMPGAPCVYYGSEVGVTGGPDPDCRRAFPWHDESTWNHELHTFYRRAIALRRSHPALRTGTFQTIYATGDVYSFARELPEEKIVVAFNSGTEPVRHRLEVSAGPQDEYRQVWPLELPPSHTVKSGALDVVIPARDAIVLVKQR